MKTAVLCVAAAICAAGWWITTLSLNGVLCFIIEKGYTPPAPKELRACIKQVMKKGG